MRRPSPLKPNARALSTALALHEFTVAELSRISGVKKVTVQGVITRSPQYFERLEVKATGKRGGQPIRYRIRDEHRADLEADFQAISRPKDFASKSAMPGRSINVPTPEAHFRVALTAVRSTLDAASGERARHQSESVRDSLRSLVRAAEEALALAQESPDHEYLKREFVTARDAVDSLIGDPELPERQWTTPQVVRDWIRDWSRGKSTIIVAAKASGDGAAAKEMFDRLMDRDGLRNLRPADMLLPAVGLAGRLNGAPGHRGLQQDIAARLADERVLENPARFAALVACAAVSDSHESLEPLLTTVTRPEFSSNLTGEARHVVLQSIARFARPGSSGDPHNAAVISYVVLNKPSVATEDFTALLPATLRGDSWFGRGLVRHVASIVYKDAARLDPATEGCLMRNLAAAGSAERMKPLAELLPELIDTEHGQRFVESMMRREYGAIRLRGHDRLGFVVSPGSELLRAGDLGDAYETPLVLQPNSGQREILNRLLIRNSSTVRRWDPPAIDASNETADGFDPRNFLGLLHAKRHRDRLAA